MSYQSPIFDLNEVHIGPIYKLYYARLSEDVKRILEKDTPEGIDDIYINVKMSSKIDHTHKGLLLHNEIFKKYQRKISKGTEDEIELAQIEYENQRNALSLKIVEDITERFRKAIFINSDVSKKLDPYFNTLFYVCLILYDVLWDTFGEDFNGWVAEKPISKLSPEDQPFEYRAFKQMEFISNLLFDYYSKPNASKSIEIVIGGISHKTYDPAQVNWLISLITAKTLPLTLSYNGHILGKLLAHKDKMEHSEFLTQLKKFTNLNVPDYNNGKRKVVKEFCLEIHKIFSYYLGLPEDTYDKPRLTIYYNILKAFRMDDFSALKRNTAADNIETIKKERPDAPQNRLRSLLTSN